MEQRTVKKILVVDDDQHLLAAIGQTLKFSRYDPQLFSNPQAALESLRSEDCLAVISDIRMPVMDGLQLLGKVLAIDADLPVIMITGHGDIALAVEAMKKGAYDFLEKPVDEEVLLASLKRAVEKRLLVQENVRLQTQLQQQRSQSFYRGMIGCHPVMNRLYDVIEMVAHESDPVLLSGETGTGKELVARAIHDARGAAGPFVPVNMAAMPADIMESELFGHERGAFTGAIRDAVGKFEFAGVGTLFLDEICSMNLALQAKLLRVLEDRQFTRVGSNRHKPLQARVISATNRDLLAEVASGSFREDLYYRLNGLQIDIPPLRERKEDIPLLAEFFRLEYMRERGRDVPPFTKEQLGEFQALDWPGNIRELRNTVRRRCVFGEPKPTELPGQEPGTESSPQQSLGEFLEHQEKEYLVKILRQHKGKVAAAAETLGLSRKGLYDKIHKYQIALEAMKG